MRYRKIDPRTWKDEKFQKLSQIEKLICLYCLTAQSNRIGLFNFSPARACEELDISLETFREGFMEPFEKVCKALHWHYDEALKVLYIPSWWKYNKPENPNVLKACLDDVHELPKTNLTDHFFNNLKYLPETYHETFLKGFSKQ